MEYIQINQRTSRSFTSQSIAFKEFVMNKILVSLALICTLFVGGCATPIQSAGAGAALGVLIGDNHRSAAYGAAAGLLGSLIFGNGNQGNQQGQAFAPQGGQIRPIGAGTLSPQACLGGYKWINGVWTCPSGQNNGYGQVPSTVHVPSNCNIDGRADLQNLKGLTSEQCAAVANMASVRVASQATADISGQQASARIPACDIKTPEKSFRFNAVNGIKFGPDQCNRYLRRQDPLPDESAMSVLP